MVNIVKYSQTMHKSEYSQTNRVFQDRGLRCGSTTEMECEGTQSVLGMLTTSFFLVLLEKRGKGASRHCSTFHWSYDTKYLQSILYIPGQWPKQHCVRGAKCSPLPLLLWRCPLWFWKGRYVINNASLLLLGLLVVKIFSGNLLRKKSY